MTYETFIALPIFAFVASATPGPNTLMLMASGANFGFRRTVPHMSGICIGFVAMIVLVGIGVMGVFQRFPEAQTVLTVVSILYLLYLAWKLANAAAPGDGGAAGKPFTFLQAALFQWVNPKAWTMSVSAMVIYAPAQDFASVLIVAGAFAAVAIPAVTLWTAIGQELRRFLTTAWRLRAFNYLMAALLVGSLYPVIFRASP